MIVTIRNETFYKVEMTAEQRIDLIDALKGLVNRPEQQNLSRDQWEVLDDLRQALLNAG